MFFDKRGVNMYHSQFVTSLSPHQTMVANSPYRKYSLMPNFYMPQFKRVNANNNSNNKDDAIEWTPGFARKSVDFCRHKISTGFAHSNDGSESGIDRKSKSLRALVRVHTDGYRNRLNVSIAISFTLKS